jgi:hypothetical protein
VDARGLRRKEEDEEEEGGRRLEVADRPGRLQKINNRKRIYAYK